MATKCGMTQHELAAIQSNYVKLITCLAGGIEEVNNHLFQYGLITLTQKNTIESQPTSHGKATRYSWVDTVLLLA